MYEENKFKINWIDLVIKIVLIIAFILFLIWLFPKQNLDLSAFNDSVFSDNINTMKEAARDYYTRDRLPENVGQSTSMSLRQMIDNKMLVRFTDKDKNYCDESASKVEVTKISENEYVLRVQLKCGDQEDYILDTIGCNSVCPDGKCEVAVNDNNNNTTPEEPTTPSVPSTPAVTPSTPDVSYFESVTYYQHRKAFYSDSINYTCPEGYTLSGTVCTKGSTGATIAATAIYFDDQVVTTDAKVNVGGEYTQYIDPIVKTIETGYTCPEGYTLNGSYCIKYTNSIEVPGNTTYVCPDGYVLNGTKCTYAYTASYATGEYNYTCPEGGTLNGTKCILTTTANVSHKDSCPSGYTLNGSNCVYSYNASYQNGDVNYTCPNGGTLNGTRCTITTPVTVNYKDSCPSGYTLNGSNCVYVYNASYQNGATKYTCPNGGTLNGTKCTITQNATVTYKEVCPSGYTANGSSCYKVYEPTKTTETTCKSGYTKSGNTCIKYTTYTATKKTTYSCPNGGTLSGTTCKKTTETNPSYNKTYSAWKATGAVQYKTSATAAYVTDTEKLEYKGAVSGATCGSPCGYKGIWYMYQKYTRTVTNTPYCTTGTLNSSKTKCVTTSTYTATSSSTYTCPNGGTLSGTTCKKTDDQYTLTTKYTCPNGGTYNSSTGKCTITTSKTKEQVTSCPTGYTKSGNKCIKEYTATKTTGNGQYYCPNGGTLNGTKCTLTTSKNSETVETCPSGYTKSGSQCIKEYSASQSTSNGQYYCPNGGVLNGTRCTLTTEKTTEEVITCPTGYTRNGTQCIKEYNSTVTQGNGQYYCPNGGTLNGTKCTMTLDATPVTGESKYTCPEGYILEGTKCRMEINATKKTEKQYSCPTGYTQSGEGENTKCYKVIKNDDTYYCEDAGATLSGTKCIKKVPGEISHYVCPTDEYILTGTTCAKRTVETINATQNKNTSVSYKYTWSTSSYLEGWEFTGKTKTEQYKAYQK